jgi:hypothetical protein
MPLAGDTLYSGGAGSETPELAEGRGTAHRREPLFIAHITLLPCAPRSYPSQV